MIRPYRLWCIILVVVQGLFCVGAGAAEPSRALATLVGDPRTDRVAVVIGNSSYPSGALANPKNDATAMAAALKMLGFDVELKIDATKADLDGIFKRFSARAERAAVAALFYAGHGIQVNGGNYIVPVDAKPQNERDLKREMIRMDDIIDDMGNAKVKLVFFDACRDNPLARSFARGSSRGMAAPVEATGTLISFATKHGNTAADGAGKHSPYTKALLEALEAPAGVEIEQILRKVQQGVKQATNGQQEPWRYGSLDGEFYFVAAAPRADSVAQQQEAIERSVQEAMKRAAGQRTSETAALAVEMSYWDSIKTSTSTDDFKAYVKRFPNGSFVELAQNRIAMLEREGKRQGDDTRGSARPAAGGTDQTAVELAFWDSIKNSSNVDDLKEYLASYPQGRFAGLARNRVRSLEPAAAPARPVVPVVPAAAPPVVAPVATAPATSPQLALAAPSRPESATSDANASTYPRAGDTWTYRYVDAWKKDHPLTVVVKVTEADNGRVTDRMSVGGGRGGDERSFEGRMEAAERPVASGARIVELLPYAQSLLKDGLKPGQDKSFPDTTIGSHSFRVKARLVGSEKVSVPAGTFDAVRIEVTGENVGTQVQWSLRSTVVASISHMLWFAPAVKRIVKAQYRSKNFSGTRVDEDLIELVAYAVAGTVPPAPIQAVGTVPAKSSLERIAALPKAGDSWTYRYVDAWKKDSPQTVVVRVEESDGGRVTDRMSMSGGRGSDERTYEGKVDAAERALGRDVRVIELLPYLQAIPADSLTPGVAREPPKLTLGGQDFRIRMTLVGQDSVVVPAGRFDALRVEIVGLREGIRPMTMHQQQVVDEIRHTIWFAPEVRRVVKIEHKSRSSFRPRIDDDTLELVSSSLR
ncbi:caspase family protein [Sulfuritalea sp.]|uniref:caspase family protein n=1 Tax=Sulfuritalea sp. TaxID=2480090 RepID=UPI001AC8B14A|nr:caspase family protein [Sulfuritalea sp.]MBN8475115.1 caspase family protein [Sulfuritalea sp.]